MAFGVSRRMRWQSGSFSSRISHLWNVMSNSFFRLVHGPTALRRRQCRMPSPPFHGQQKLCGLASQDKMADSGLWELLRLPLNRFSCSASIMSPSLTWRTCNPPRKSTMWWLLCRPCSDCKLSTRQRQRLILSWQLILGLTIGPKWQEVPLPLRHQWNALRSFRKSSQTLSTSRSSKSNLRLWMTPPWMMLNSSGWTVWSLASTSWDFKVKPIKGGSTNQLLAWTTCSTPFRSKGKPWRRSVQIFSYKDKPLRDYSSRLVPLTRICGLVCRQLMRPWRIGLRTCLPNESESLNMND